jgi:pimeloyl-ACP methyl ester carboxylesterase
LTGGDSPPYLKAATEALRAALPESRVVSLPGQRHLAMDGSPGPFAAEVTRFLLG